MEDVGKLSLGTARAYRKRNGPMYFAKHKQEATSTFSASRKLPERRANGPPTPSRSESLTLSTTRWPPTTPPSCIATISYYVGNRAADTPLPLLSRTALPERIGRSSPSIGRHRNRRTATSSMPCIAPPPSPPTRRGICLCTTPSWRAMLMYSLVIRTGLLGPEARLWVLPPPDRMLCTNSWPCTNYFPQIALSTNQRLIFLPYGLFCYHPMSLTFISRIARTICRPGCSTICL